MSSQGWNECFIVASQDDEDSRLIEISRRVRPDSSIPKDLKYPPSTYATVRFSGDDLAQRTPVATLDSTVQTPVCEGSLVAHAGDLYFSHPQSKTQRANLTVHKSTDNGSQYASNPPLVVGLRCFLRGCLRLQRRGLSLSLSSGQSAATVATAASRQLHTGSALRSTSGPATTGRILLMGPGRSFCSRWYRLNHSFEAMYI